MIKCQKCGKTLPDGTKFCDGCGAKIKKGKGLKIALITGSIGAVLVAAVAILLVIAIVVGAAFFIFLKQDKTTIPNYAAYVKDGEILYSDLKEDNQSIAITERLDDNGDAEKDDWGYIGYYLSELTVLSQDGSLIFYPDKSSYDFDDYDFDFNLYYREINDEKFVPVKIDSDISSYDISDDAETVTYLRKKDGNLYEYTLETDSREKIASDVTNFVISDDESKLMYMTGEGDVYLKTEEDKEKVVSDIYSLVYLDDDFTTIYYVKDSTLFKQKFGEDRQKIADDITSVTKVYDSGEVYFTRSEEVNVTYMSLVNDDLAASDAAIQEPVKPTAPEFDDYYYAYDSYWDAYDAYWDAYDDYYDKLDAYWDAYDIYLDKKSRDELRARLAEKTYSYENISLYYYSGEDESLIVENYSYTLTYAEDTAVISYKAYDRSGNKKINLSEIDSLWDFEDYNMLGQFHENTYVDAAIKNSSLDINDNNVYDIEINDSGKDIYYVSTKDDEYYGDLYHIEVKGDSASSATLYDEDVYAYGYFLTNDKFSYYKDYENGSGELFINAQSIDYDVYDYSYYEDSDTLLYIADYNEDKAYGILKSYTDGEIVKISDDVYSYKMSPEGDILYLYDYSKDYYRGELYMWKDQEKIKIDDDVSTLLSYRENHRSFYRWSSYN